MIRWWIAFSTNKLGVSPASVITEEKEMVRKEITKADQEGGIST